MLLWELWELAYVDGWRKRGQMRVIVKSINVLFVRKNFKTVGPLVPRLPWNFAKRFTQASRGGRRNIIFHAVERTHA